MFNTDKFHTKFIVCIPVALRMQMKSWSVCFCTPILTLSYVMNEHCVSVKIHLTRSGIMAAHPGTEAKLT